MKELEVQIKKVEKLFLQFGIKSVSMNDIARELGLSKKKLYQIFADKTELVEKIISSIKLKMENIVEEYNNSALNAIEKEIYHRKKYLKIKPTFIYDLKKYYPSIFEDYISFKKKQISKSSHKLISEGKEQGLYRDDIDPEFISKLSVTLMCSIFHPDLNEISEKT